jgi:hypothetical protein
VLETGKKTAFNQNGDNTKSQDEATKVSVALSN